MANPALTSCLLFTVIHQILALSVDIPQPVYEVARGDNATITCTFVPQVQNPTKVVITWLAKSISNPDEETDIVTYFHYTNDPDIIDISSDYTNRVAFSQDIIKGQTSLTLTGVTSKDNTTILCKVKIPGDNVGKQSDTAKLVVLVAPSKPNCNIQGKTDFYQNITMTCLSDEGIPTPAYKWQRYDTANNPTPSLPIKSTDVNGLLSLYNLSADHSGYYICTATNKMRSASCNVTLAVSYPSINIASTAGIIGGCVAGVILIIIICCCCCRRKKDENEEYTMGSVKDGEFPNNDPDEIKQEEGRRIEVQADQHENEEPGGDRQGRLAPSDRYDDRQSDRYSDRYDDRRSDRYDDRRSDRYDDRRSDRYDDRRSDRNDDSRSDRYDDRRSDRNDDSRSDRYDDRRRDRYDDSRDRYDDRRRDDRYDDRRRDDRYDDRHDDRRGRYDQPDDGYDRNRPQSVPVNKPPRG